MRLALGPEFAHLAALPQHHRAIGKLVQAAGPDVVGSDSVRDVDDRRTGGDARDDGVTDADELIAQAKVRDEDDRFAHDGNSPHNG